MKKYDEIIASLDNGAAELDFSGIHFTRDQLNDLVDKVNNNSLVGHIIWGTLPNEAGQIVKQIENKLIQNNKSYKAHPTDFIHGLLSAHAYQSIGDSTDTTVSFNNTNKQHYNKYLKDWKIYKIFNDEESSSYYGIIYLNNISKQMVLAHCGTAIEGATELQKLTNLIFRKDSDLQTNIKGIFGKEIVAQQVVAYVATKEATDYAKANKYSLSTTGHSLGAWLAEISAYYCYRDFDYPNIRTVNFDSPGSVAHMDNAESNIRNYKTELDVRNLDIVTYLSAPNLINACNQHTGKVYRLFPEIARPENLDKQLDWIYKIPVIGAKLKSNEFLLNGILSLAGHSLEPLLTMFDADTGKPVKYKEVLDWPTIKYTPEGKTGETIINTLLDIIPGSNMVPSILKKAASKAITSFGPSNTLTSLVGVIGEFLSGNIDLNQHFKCYEFIDSYTNKAGYEVSVQLNTEQNFSLTYEGHYRIKEIDLLQDVLATNNKGSADWCLSRLAKCNIKALEQNLDESSSLQLINIKKQYKIISRGGKKYIKLEQEFDVEKLKENLLRLVTVNPKVKDVIENPTFYYRIDSNEIITSQMPERVTNFIGRENIFTQIDNIFNTYQCVAVNAFAGVGKSSIALEYGHRQLDNNSKEKIVHWFSADTSDKVEVEYRKLATELGIDLNHSKDIIIRLVNNKIIKLDKPVLFIFDNVEHYQDIQEYIINLPKEQIKVLITTKDSNLLNNSKQHIKLEPFSRQDAEEYISLNLPRRTNAENIKELIDALGSKDGDILPYKLSKTISYLREKKLYTVAKYIEYIKQSSNNQTETTLLIKLVEESSISWQILQYAVHLDPDSISIEIFKELFKLDEDELQEPITKLEKLSLIDLNYLDNNVHLKIHRLAQEEIKSYINKHPDKAVPIANVYEHLITSLNNLMPTVTNLPDKKWQEALIYYSHVNKVLNDNQNIALAKQGELFIKLGSYEHLNCNFKKSLINEESALKIYQNLYKGNHSYIAMSLNNVGIAYQTLGDAKKGLEYQEQALAMRKALYSGNHPQIANTLVNIAEAYQTLGNAKKGLEYQEQALAMRKALYSGNHPDVAGSLNNIGVAYHTLGDAKKGLEYQEQALVVRQALYSGNHPDVAGSLNNVGVAYQILGDAKKGLEYQEQALVMRQALYSGNHPDVATSLGNVGSVYQALGTIQKGLEYKEQSLLMRQALYNDNHPSIAFSLNNVGAAYQALGNIQKGLEFKEQALTIYQTLYKGNHPSIADSLNNVGAAYQALGNIQKGLEYCEQALVMKQALYKGNHPSVAILLNNLGVIYKAVGDIQKGLEYQEQALAMRQALYSGNHPDVANSLYHVGNAYQILGNKQKRLEYQEQALTIYQALYKDNHPSIISSLNNVGFAYLDLGNVVKAKALFEQAYLMSINVSGNNHPNTLTMKNNLIELFPEVCEDNNKIQNIDLNKVVVEQKIISNEDITLQVKQKINISILKNVYIKAAEGKWSYGLLTTTTTILGNWGVKSYLNDAYLKKKLGNLANPDTIRIAKMLCFKAICSGVVNSKDKNLTCVTEFKKLFPNILKKIISEHPEYMIDKLIVRECVSDPQLLNKLLDNNNFSGQGTAEYIHVDSWMEYTKEGMNKLLKLKLQAIEKEEVKVILPDYVWDGTQKTTKILINQITTEFTEKSLIVLNLYSKHWVGLVIERIAESININYMDSEQRPMPILLKKHLFKQFAAIYPKYSIELTEVVLEYQKYNNCGSEVIENFTAYLIGEERTISQDDAIAIHSLLFEDSLILEANN